jgi:hypothetical protein
LKITGMLGLSANVFVHVEGYLIVILSGIFTYVIDGVV